jgi:hypothetical protein
MTFSHRAILRFGRDPPELASDLGIWPLVRKLYRPGDCRALLSAPLHLVFFRLLHRGGFKHEGRRRRQARQDCLFAKRIRIRRLQKKILQVKQTDHVLNLRLAMVY